MGLSYKIIVRELLATWRVVISCFGACPPQNNYKILGLCGW